MIGAALSKTVQELGAKQKRIQKRLNREKLKQAMAKKRAGKLPAISSRRKDKVKEKKTTGGEEHVSDAAAGTSIRS